MEEIRVTEVLQEWRAGDPAALERLMPKVVGELRALAKSHFRKEASGHTLQPTALVNEVYLRLSEQLRPSFENRTQFFAFASSLIRRILVDHYRARCTAKRGCNEAAVTLDEALGVPTLRDCEFVALDDALAGLETLDPRQSRVVELRFFGGLTVPETATMLNISPATVKREWVSAKAFLLHEMRAS
jgi:RNA polymerase sigma factor (TIGR02999 family)